MLALLDVEESLLDRRSSDGHDGRARAGRAGSTGAGRCEHLMRRRHRCAAGHPEGCEECLRDGTHWVHLRLCLTCGHVGCCDSSPQRHADKHFQETRTR